MGGEGAAIAPFPFSPAYSAAANTQPARTRNVGLVALTESTQCGILREKA